MTGAAAGDTLVLPYNDTGAVAEAFAAHGPEIACLITEACPANMGVVPPEPGFNELLAGSVPSTARCSSWTRCSPGSGSPGQAGTAGRAWPGT